MFTSMLLFGVTDIPGILNLSVLGIPVKMWLIIGVGIFLFASGRLKLADIIAAITGKPVVTPPGPGPTPGPVVTPTPIPGIDMTSLMQLLFQLFLKAEATNDPNLKAAVSTVSTHLNIPLTNVPPAFTQIQPMQMQMQQPVQQVVR